MKKAKQNYDPLDDFMYKYGHLINEPKKTKPIKAVNLQTLSVKLNQQLLEVKSGLIGRIVIIDEWKGLGILPLNRCIDVNDPNNIVYEDQESFEGRVSEGRLKLL